VSQSKIGEDMDAYCKVGGGMDGNGKDGGINE